MKSNQKIPSPSTLSGASYNEPTPPKEGEHPQEPNTTQGAAMPSHSSGEIERKDEPYNANLQIALHGGGKAYTVVIPKQLLLKVKFIAKGENVRVKDVASQLLATGISRWEEKNGIIDDAALAGIRPIPFKKKLIIT